MKTTFYIPVIGLQIEMSTIQVGDVTFLKSYREISDSAMKNFIDKIIPSESEKDIPHSSYLKGLLENSSIAVVQGNKTSDAETVANLEVERALNVLRFYLPALSGSDPFAQRMYMWIAGVPNTGTATFFSMDETTKLVTTTASTRGALFPYVFRLQTLEKMKQLHFELMNKMLRQSQSQRTSLQNNVITAIDFFGAAMNELKRRNMFLNFVISLEAALLDRSDKKPSKLAALIGELLQVKKDKRKKLFKTISAYYGIRSDIVHEGIDNVKQDDIYGIFSMTFRTIAKLIPYTEKAKGKKQLRKIVYSESKAKRQK